MAEQNAQRRPGDLILDRYMPNATPEEREAARENLRAALTMLIRLEEQRALRDGGKPDSPKEPSQDRFEAGPTGPTS